MCFYFQVHNLLAPSSAVEIVYPPSHLQHILFELFKNSMRAIIESKKSIDLPDIDVLVAQGKDDVTIKISDQVIFVFRSSRSLKITWKRSYVKFQHII